MPSAVTRVQGENGRWQPSEERAMLNHRFFSDSTPNSRWLAGLIAADGCVNERAWTIAQSGDHGMRMIEHVRHLTNHRLSVTATHRKRGAVSYGIYAPSAQMVNDLSTVYGIEPRKTLTYGWPGIEADVAHDFVRGYIDGDGCVGVYTNTKGISFLHISLVGTESFIEGARSTIPANGRVTHIARCKNLFELRFSALHAWDAGRWIYQTADLYPSKKYATFRECVSGPAPTRLRQRDLREQGLEMFRSGGTVSEVAAATGVAYRLAWQWRKKNLEVPA